MSYPPEKRKNRSLRAMGIPVCVPAIPQNAVKYVTSTIEKNWVSSLCLDEDVHFINKLEKGFSSFCHAKYGILTTSGTTALTLAIASLDIKPGDEIVVPSFTMIASVTSIIHNGAIPVFVDSDEDTWCIDHNKVEEKISEKTKAIMVVHMYGYPAEMRPILNLAKKHNLRVIEDAAEAIGTKYQ
jgi:perosamine synthetase